MKRQNILEQLNGLTSDLQLELDKTPLDGYSTRKLTNSFLLGYSTVEEENDLLSSFDGSVDSSFTVYSTEESERSAKRPLSYDHVSFQREIHQGCSNIGYMQDLLLCVTDMLEHENQTIENEIQGVMEMLANSVPCNTFTVPLSFLRNRMSAQKARKRRMNIDTKTR